MESSGGTFGAAVDGVEVDALLSAVLGGDGGRPMQAQGSWLRGWVSWARRRRDLAPGPGGHLHPRPAQHGTTRCWRRWSARRLASTASCLDEDASAPGASLAFAFRCHCLLILSNASFEFRLLLRRRMGTRPALPRRFRPRRARSHTSLGTIHRVDVVRRRRPRRRFRHRRPSRRIAPLRC